MGRVRWRELLEIAAFRRLWCGNSVSLLGDWFTYVAVGTLAVSDGTLWAVAVVLLAHTLPRAVFSPLAGRLADRVDRRTLVIGFSVLRAAIVAAMIVAVDAGALAAVQVLLFVRMALGAFVDPAASAALPQLVPAAGVGPANARSNHLRVRGENTSIAEAMARAYLRGYGRPRARLRRASRW